MYGKLKGNKLKKRASAWETLILILFGGFAFVVAGDLSNRGIAQKWATALFATLLTFGCVIFIHRQRLLRWSFWTSLTICLGVHVTVVWAFFQYVLNDVRRFSMLLWYPIILVEVFVLLIAVKRLEAKLTGKDETIKISF